MLKRKIVSTILVLFSFITAYSQDYISINNAKKIKVKVLEIGSEYLIYELWKDDGIRYRVNRSKITKIKFDDSIDVVFRDSYPVFSNSEVVLKSAENKNYLVGEEWIGSFWALESHFNKNSEAAQYFFKAKKQRSAARVLGYSSIGFVVGGFILASTTYYDYDLAFAVGVISFFIVGPTLGTAGIIAKINSINNKKNTEDAYGIRYVNQSLNHPYNNAVTLGLGVTQNGIGLVMNF